MLTFPAPANMSCLQHTMKFGWTWEIGWLVGLHIVIKQERDPSLSPAYLMVYITVLWVDVLTMMPDVMFMT